MLVYRGFLWHNQYIIRINVISVKSLFKSKFALDIDVGQVFVITHFQLKILPRKTIQTLLTFTPKNIRLSLNLLKHNHIVFALIRKRLLLWSLVWTNEIGLRINNIVCTVKWFGNQLKLIILISYKLKLVLFEFITN